MYTSVLQEWVMELPLRAQGALLTSIRGCDLSFKNPFYIDERYGCSTGEEPAERALVSFLRYCFLVPADAREVDVPGAWMRSTPPKNWKPSQFGHYPLHWFTHVMHAFQVAGYHHPNQEIRFACTNIYMRMVKSLHLEPEIRKRWDERINEDRIANETIVS